ncbi:MAG: hypothetical protein IJR83_03590 [Clostridia bacterium]|nr:hypothetical protein [Clostridia bacterium]
MKLTTAVRKNELSHGSIPFWSWNDRLEPEHLRRQIRDMHRLGMKGFFMHARGGLETEYLSDDWYECVNACIDEAKKLGMEAWAYDENGWPSGFAGGILLKDKRNWASFISVEESDEFPKKENILGVYVIRDGEDVRVDGPVPGADRYYAVLQNWDSSYVDTMDPEITDKFISETHKAYKERIAKEDFGTAMPGFFTDEPQYYRWGTPWSDTFRKTYEAEYGHSVFDHLLCMFMPLKDYELYRYEYYRLCHRSFIFNFIKRVYDWCLANGCQLTGHAVEELSLGGEMFGCGGIMPFYLYETMPGVDFLTRGRVGDPGFRQLGSVVAQRGCTHALSEMFACCGWDVSPLELKRIAEHQYVNGINVMCQHLYPYSIRGQRKRDYPCHYSEHLPWQEDMKEFNTYFNRLGYVLSLGKEDVRVLVIHPIHSAWLTYQRAEGDRSVRDLNSDFQALSDLFSCSQIPFHFGDETVMEQLHAKAEGPQIVVGKCRYDYVVVPAMDNLDRETYRILRKYVRNGGKIWLYGKKPCRLSGHEADLELESNTTLEEMKQAAAVCCESPMSKWIRVMSRNTKYGRIVYVLNLADESAGDVLVRIKDVSGMARLDLATLTVQPVHGTRTQDGIEVRLRPDRNEAFVLVESDINMLPGLPAREGEAIRLPRQYRIARPVLNQLTIDRFSVSRDGGKTFSEELPIECIRDNLLKERFKGDLILRATFLVRDVPQKISAAMEPADYLSVSINGKSVRPGEETFLDRSFRMTDLSPYVKAGENVLEFKLHYEQRDYVYYVLYGGVSESLRNCLSFDTELECVYLVGSFCVGSVTPFRKGDRGPSYAEVTDGPFEITKQEETVDITDLVRNGYPFFAGRIELKTEFDWQPGMPTVLRLRGRCPIVKAFLNGKQTGSFLFTEHNDVSGLLKPGRNSLRLELVNSNRNLLGPHHTYEIEPFGVGPRTFSFENGWNGTECGEYNPQYAFVRLGLDAQ